MKVRIRGQGCKINRPRTEADGFLLHQPNRYFKGSARSAGSRPWKELLLLPLLFLRTVVYSFAQST